MDRLKAVVGPKGYLAGDDIGAGYVDDLSGYRSEPPAIVLRPANTDEVSAIMKLCHAAGQPVVPQGGMTGLASAGAPFKGEVVLAFQRMNAIEDVDTASATVTAQAGAPLQIVQQAADGVDMLFPLDIGARGSCTVGGNLSTNAGGNRVIRYGMARDLVLGIEVVLADGTVLNGLHKMRKNNAGYDLKHLFMGAEGTLGVITRATLKMLPKPRSQLVAFCALKGFPDGVRLLRFLDGALGPRLTAFEALWDCAYRLILDWVPNVRPPMAPGNPFHVLVECMGSNPEADEAAFEAALGEAIEQGIITDAVIGKTGKEVQDLWSVRDGIAEAVQKLRPMLSYDISMPIGDMEAFSNKLLAEKDKNWPDARIAVFGHIGDGNLHVCTNIGIDGVTPRSEVDNLVYGGTRAVHGSVSAEHGIGIQKKKWLAYTRTEAEIAVMRNLKQMFDPKNILSPGRVL